jgi:hypothetical protein
LRNTDIIRAALRRQPFQPFRLEMVSGAVFNVEHPEWIAVPPGKNPRDVALFTPVALQADDYEAHWLDVGLIQRVVTSRDVEPAARTDGNAEEN